MQFTYFWKTFLKERTTRAIELSRFFPLIVEISKPNVEFENSKPKIRFHLVNDTYHLRTKYIWVSFLQFRPCIASV